MSGGGYPPGYGGPSGNNPPGGFSPPGSPGGYGPPPPQGPPGYGAPAPGYMPQGYAAGGPLGVSPHAPYGIDPVSGLPFSDKQKIVALVLQLFLRTLGAGRFYTGHTMIAVLQLLFGWLTCGIWPLVDAILMGLGKVPDAQGRPLRD